MNLFNKVFILVAILILSVAETYGQQNTHEVDPEDIGVAVSPEAKQSPPAKRIIDMDDPEEIGVPAADAKPTQVVTAARGINMDDPEEVNTVIRREETDDGNDATNEPKSAPKHAEDGMDLAPATPQQKQQTQSATEGEGTGEVNPLLPDQMEYRKKAANESVKERNEGTSKTNAATPKKKEN